MLDLLFRVKKILESKTCGFLIVVGYSFRDDHITRIVLDAARRNKNLHVILIAPNAYKVYYEKLKYYKHGRPVSSSLDGRVCCLPYKFEGIFGELKNILLKNMREAILKEQDLRKREISGETVNWLDTLNSYCAAEYFEKVDGLLGKIPPETLLQNWQIAIRIYINTSINLLAGGEIRYVQYFQNAVSILRNILMENVHIELTSSPGKDYKIEHWLNYTRSENSTSYTPVEHFESFIESIHKNCKWHAGLLDESFEKHMHVLSDNLEALKAYLHTLKPIYLREYVATHSSYMTAAGKKLELVYKNRRFEELPNIILEIEKEKATKVLNSLSNSLTSAL